MSPALMASELGSERWLASGDSTSDEDPLVVRYSPLLAHECKGPANSPRPTRASIEAEFVGPRGTTQPIGQRRCQVFRHLFKRSDSRHLGRKQFAVRPSPGPD